MHCYMYGKKDIINKKRLIGINLFGNLFAKKIITGRHTYIPFGA